MLQFLRTYRNVLLAIALLLVASLVWISNSKSEKERNVLDRGVVWVSTPLVRVITWSTNGVRDLWNRYVGFVGLREEYDGALLDKQALEAEVNRLKEAEAENERLYKLLALSRDLGGQDVVAKVVGVDDVAFAQTLLISKGYKHGIRQNMPVVTTAGVVGRVTKARGGSAEVMLMTDPNSAIPVRVQRTRAQGILEGTGKEYCRIKYISRNADVKVGDHVITAGLAGVFPAGVPVGVVTEVANRDDAVTQDVRVVPAVDFRRLPDEVLVLLEVPTFPAGDDEVFEEASLAAGGNE